MRGGGMSGRNSPEKFFEQYPSMRRWVNECVTCHRKGYRPETPLPEEETMYPTPWHLRRYFDELDLDESGVCEQCRNTL